MPLPGVLTHEQGGGQDRYDGGDVTLQYCEAHRRLGWEVSTLMRGD